jgi:hypothetical protein
MSGLGRMIEENKLEESNNCVFILFKISPGNVDTLKKEKTLIFLIWIQRIWREKLPL